MNLLGAEKQSLRTGEGKGGRNYLPLGVVPEVHRHLVPLKIKDVLKGLDMSYIISKICF